MGKVLILVKLGLAGVAGSVVAARNLSFFHVDYRMDTNNLGTDCNFRPNKGVSAQPRKTCLLC